MTRYLLIPLFLLCSSGLHAQAYKFSKTDNPRDTLVSFMEAMNDYREGILQGDQKKQNRIDDALQTMDLSEFPPLMQKEKGREAAIYLKEFIDRVIVVEPQYIPEGPVNGSNPLMRWRLKDTEVVILRVLEGENRGEYLISSESVQRAREFFEKVQDQPYLEDSGQGAAYQSSLLDRSLPAWVIEGYFGYSLWQWLGLLLMFLLGLGVKKLSKLFLVPFKYTSQKSATKWDDRLLNAIEDPIGWILFGCFCYLTVHLLRFDGGVLSTLLIVIQIIFSYGMIWAIYRLTDLLSIYLQEWNQIKEEPLDAHLIPLINRSVKISVVVFGSLLALQNLGVNILSLIAGLGIGGLAFALAAKDTAANFFGSMMIFLDQPFRIGDWIVVDGNEGTVEAIGFRSTRIRTFYNSQIYIPNSVVANSNIDNMGRREFRRTMCRLGLTYDTKPDRVQAFVEGIKEILLNNEKTRKDYFHVVFDAYGDSSLEILLYYFLKVKDWSEELQYREKINLEIYSLAERIGVSFAFPTQTVHVESFPQLPKSSISNG